MNSNKNNNKQNLGMITIGLLLIGVGFACGWLGFLLFGDIAKNCQVVFVSKEAIIRAEEERVKDSLKNDVNNETANRVFFGRTNEALGYIEAIANSYSDRKTKVLFVSTDSGSGRNGEAISEIVHEEVIKILSKVKYQK